MPFPPDVIAAAQASMRKWKVPASVSLAQWALESNYGRSEPAGSNNPFGIKAIAGQPFVTSWTHETLNGVYQAIPQHFARFASLEDAFDAHGRLLATSHYYVKAQHETDPDRFAMDLQGIYATGIPGHPYGAALIAIMKAADLYQYDGAAPAAAAAALPGAPPILQLGSSGPEVEQLQHVLSIAVTGTFDQKTKTAVMAFQAAHGYLKVDGIVGPKTQVALNALAEAA